MPKDKVYAQLEKAINSKKQIVFSYTDGTGREAAALDLHPIILGDDVFQTSFVWGFLPWLGNYQKLYLDKIKKIEIKQEPFLLRDDAVYFNSDQEEVFAAYPGFMEGGYMYSGNISKGQVERGRKEI